MHILSFLLEIKCRNFLKANKHTVTLVSNTFLFLAAVGNTYGFSLLLNYLSGAKSGYDVSPIIGYVICLIFSVPILLLFIPSYRSRVNLFNRHDPLNKFPRSFIEVAYNFFSPVYIVLILCVLLLFAISGHFGILHAIVALLAIVASSICCMIIQEILAAELPGFPKVIFSTGFVTLSVYSINVFPLSAAKTVTMIGLLFLIHYLLPYQGPGVFSGSRTDRHSPKHLFQVLTKIYFRTFPVKVNLVLAFLFKVTFLLIFFSKSGKGSSFLENLKYLFITSLGLFTYIHNNIWGYLKTTYKSIALKKDLGCLFKSYVLLLATPVLMDAFLSIFFLAVFHKLAWSLLLFYLLCLSCYILIGFYSSVSKPVEISVSLDFTHFKANTPVGFNILSLFVTVAFSILLSNGLFLYFSLFLFLLLGYSYYALIVKSRIVNRSGDIYTLL